MAVGMMRLPALPVFALLAAAPLGAQEVALRCLSDFAPGLYVARVGREAGPGRCLANAAELAMAGRTGGPGCRVTMVRDLPEAGTITWSCPDGRSGRSDIRRDAAGIYTVSAQGIEDGLPWASRAEWRRIGPCPGALLGRPAGAPG
jgi:hypothetical protein